MSDERKITLKKDKDSGKAKKQSLTKRTVVSALIILILVPLTIYLGWRFADKQYYITGLLIILYSIIPFFIAFERKKPNARELVIIAVMCAIAVASRAAFIWAPQFKPIVGIIIIAGVALGPETGFITGAVSAFVSNFIFGQGPWTPWQMFAFGIAGFLAGLLYQKGILSRNRLPLSIFGGLVVLLIVGPILDTQALFSMISTVTPASAGATYLSGLPLNAVHAAAVFLTLLLLSKPMFDKLDRVKLKYGLAEGENAV